MLASGLLELGSRHVAHSATFMNTCTAHDTKGYLDLSSPLSLQSWDLQHESELSDKVAAHHLVAGECDHCSPDTCLSSSPVVLFCFVLVFVDFFKALPTARWKVHHWDVWLLETQFSPTRRSPDERSKRLPKGHVFWHEETHHHITKHTETTVVCGRQETLDWNAGGYI